MKKFTTYLLTITLFLSFSAQDSAAKKKDCVNIHTEGSFTTPLFRPCTGDEEIFLTIHFKAVGKRCVDESGRVKTSIHFQYHGTGVGSTTGNEYVLNAQEKDIVITTPTCEFSSTHTFYQVLISKGPQPNVRLINNSTFTVDSNCQASSTQEFEVICQGQ
jgi:hypothetical protein